METNPPLTFLIFWTTTPFPLLILLLLVLLTCRSAAKIRFPREKAKKINTATTNRKLKASLLSFTNQRITRIAFSIVMKTTKRKSSDEEEEEE